jgi:hypothetical protein
MNSVNGFAKNYSPVRRTLLLFLCLCGGFGIIPRSLWAQNVCADEFVHRDELRQWVEYDRTQAGTPNLETNETKLANANKDLNKCLKERLAGNQPSKPWEKMVSWLLLTVELASNHGISPKTSRRKVLRASRGFFEGHITYEQKVQAVGLLSPSTKQVEDAFFLSCLDYAQNRMDLTTYQANQQAYRELHDFKRVSRAQDIGSGQVSVGCTDGAGLETPVLYFGKSPQITGSRAVWAGTDNLKNQDQVIIDEIHDPTSGALIGMRAHSHMQGLDRNWVGNCPGGGHGEVVLHVEWTELVPINVNNGSASGQ